MGIQPLPECRAPRKIRKGEAETVAWPSSVVGRQAQEGIVKMFARGAGARPKTDEGDLLQHTLLCACWFGGNARFWSAVPMDIGPGRGGSQCQHAVAAPGRAAPMCHAPCLSGSRWFRVYRSHLVSPSIILGHDVLTAWEEDARGGDDGQQAVLLPLSPFLVSGAGIMTTKPK